MSAPVNASLSELAVSVSACDSPPPAVIPVRLTVCSPASSPTVTTAGWSSVGASFTAVTSKVMVLAVGSSAPPLSFTWNVKDA